MTDIIITLKTPIQCLLLIDICPTLVTVDTGQVVHTQCASVHQKQYKFVPAIGWQGNRRSGVVLAMCHRLKWYIHLQTQRPGKWRRAPFRVLPLSLSNTSNLLHYISKNGL